MAENEPVEPAEGATPDPAQELGEGGKKALEAERKARAAAEKLAAEREAKLREYEDRDKTEEQRRQEEKERLERELSELTVAKTRAEISASTSIPVGILAGPASGSPEDIQSYADMLAAWRGEQQPAAQEYSIPAAGKRPELALNGDGLEAALKHALGIK